jgi:hypothetical protein
MRRLIQSLALAVSLSAVGASSAMAAAPEGAQKAPLYGPEFSSTCTGGAAATAHTFGFAILNTAGNETALSGVVSLKGAAPNATYRVEPVQAEPEAVLCGVLASSIVLLHTNGKGNGTVEFSGERVPGNTTFNVEVFNVAPPFDEYGSPAVELD